MKEIGSEFWKTEIIHQDNGLFPERTQWYLSGRSALISIINDLGNIRSVAMPSWCCDSMIKPFYDAGIEVSFYSFNDPRSEEAVSSKCDAMLLLDHFGFIKKHSVDRKCIVIRDLTHSVFSDCPNDADYYFGSLRKWSGLWTGGYAWTGDGHELVVEDGDRSTYISLRKTAMDLKEAYINNPRRYGTNDLKKRFLEIFSAAEEILKNAGALSADDRDIRMAKKLDVEFIKRTRRNNAEILMEAFRDMLVFPQLGEDDCPLFVPIIVPDGKRDDLRKHLINNKIYCPVHWPLTQYHKMTVDKEYIYRNSLSLICDQRYDETDMKRIINTVIEFLRI